VVSLAAREYRKALALDPSNAEAAALLAGLPQQARPR
jgi:hypothetical protein